MPNMSARYREGTRRSCQQKNDIIVEHYYHVNIFNVVIDFHLMELSSRFNEQNMELLTLSSSLSQLINFTRTKLDALRRQLEHYEYVIVQNSEFQSIASLSRLLQVMVETRRSEHFFLVDRLIHLVLTLCISTATIERAFSAMNLLKTRIQNKMDNAFLVDSLVVYIEREIANSIDVDSMIDEFDTKPRKVKHSITKIV
ncbi:hypothetical protein PTKIN_Ptkin10aG0052700 [Pterospermum kingtungense]